MSKYTPGSWVVGYGKTREIEEVLAVAVNTAPDWTPICILSPASTVNEADIANAHLIAAAPELLAHLQFAVKLFEGIPALNATAQVDAMRNVITKAEGNAT